MDDFYNNQKVVLFPKLVTRLVEKGMMALEEKRNNEAVALFEQAISLENDHPEARYGLVLAKVELGSLESAAEECRKMLVEAIGDYFEVLSIYLSLLVQLAEYEEVVTILEAVLSEGNFPAKKAELFYQLLALSRQMIEKRNETVQPIVKKDADVDISFIKQLDSTKKKEQLTAIQKLWKQRHPKVIEAFSNYITKDENDLVLKSFVLQALKEMKIDTKVKIVKLGNEDEVIPAQLAEPSEQPFFVEVKTLISQMLEDDNPTLKEGVIQLLDHFTLALYPFLPSPNDTHLWAAAVHLAGLKSYAIDYDEHEVAQSYGVASKEAMTLATKILEIERQLFTQFE